MQGFSHGAGVYKTPKASNMVTEIKAILPGGFKKIKFVVYIAMVYIAPKGLIYSKMMQKVLQ